jgi:polysaccharide biosynthesis/export protein VpsN
MGWVPLVALLGLWLALGSGCQREAHHPRVALSPPVESTTLGPGDTFRLEIVGEKELPSEYQVASDGTVDFPYIQSLTVSGLEPQQVARLVRDRLIEARILTDPSVVVSVKEYRSKRVVVLGQVKAPGSFPFQAGMTLIQAISQAGGLNAIAESDRVRLTRRLHGGGTQSVVIDLEAINDGKGEDVLLQSGDRIYVQERIF